MTGLALGHIDASRLDLKIAASALAEMGRAFDLFAHVSRDPEADDVRLRANRGVRPSLRPGCRPRRPHGAENWLVVTGAGPGIMAAGSRRGRLRTCRSASRSGFLSRPRRIPSSQPRAGVVEMKYFFTRKLMLMKESAAFAVLPGGFGTLDECFELLTLLQTGKAEPAPIVLLDLPGDPYWEGLERFVTGDVDAPRAWSTGRTRPSTASPTTSAVAVEEILGFYRNYHSRRFVGPTMVIRCQFGPDRRGAGRA